MLTQTLELLIQVNSYVLENEIKPRHKKMFKMKSRYKGILTKYFNKKYPIEDMRVLSLYGCTRLNTFACIYDSCKGADLFARIEFYDLNERLLPITGSSFDRNLTIEKLGIDKKQFKKNYLLYADYLRDKIVTFDKNKETIQRYESRNDRTKTIFDYFPNIQEDKTFKL